MKRKAGTWILIIGFCLVSVAVLADVFDNIAQAFRAGDAKAIAKYFDNNIELRIADKGSVYSRNQAELVLKEFLNNNAPKAFNVVHRGSSAKGALYAIGTMETSKGNYRTYILVKEVGGKQYIEELQFEKQ